MTFKKNTYWKGKLTSLLLIIVGIMFAGCTPDKDPLYVTKTGEPATFTEVGEVITYEIHVSNWGDTDIVEVTVTDPFMEVTCPRDYLWEEYGYLSCSGTYEITEEDIEAGKVTNKATVRGYQEGPCGTQGRWIEKSDEFTITMEEVIALELTKIGTPNWFNGAGENISYSYTVKNSGNTFIAGPITVIDDLVEVDCPEGDLDWGESLVCTASYTITEADAAAMQVKNTATASAGDVVSNEASFVVYLEKIPELTLTKTAKPKVFSQAGQLITYTFELENTGNVTIDPPFEIDDPQLEDWTCPHESLKPGEKVTCTGIYYTREGDVGGTFKNCATMYAVFQGGQMTSNEACTQVGYDEPEKKPSACDIDPDSDDCFCEKYPQDC